LRSIASQILAECDKQCDIAHLFSTKSCDVNFHAPDPRFANQKLCECLFPRPNPRTSRQPKSSPGVLPKVSLADQILGAPIFKGPRFSRRCGGEIFASRLRQPCGGVGSEGRALAIPRASGAGWAGAWVARPLKGAADRHRTTPAQTAWDWPPNHDGGAEDSTNTRGAPIAAETTAPRGCWPRPRSGMQAASDNVSSRERGGPLVNEPAICYCTLSENGVRRGVGTKRRLLACKVRWSLSPRPSARSVLPECSAAGGAS
jgi:hypothetical protein